jgi:hypothetical protein
VDCKRRRGPRRHLSIVVIATLAALCLGAAGGLGRARAAADPAYSRAVDGVEALDRQVLANFMGLARNDPRWYRNGVWYEPGSDCFWCLDAAATAAAVLSRETTPPDPALLSVAEQTLNGEIDGYQQPDGSWDETGIVTGFVTVELGTSYLELQDLLDPGTKAKWAAAIRRAADFIVSSKNLTWYTNGNVNLRNAAVMWLAWKITGDAAYQADYENEWSFTLSPPQTRWPGFGLQLTRAPTKADGSDGAGYLAESGGGTPGFDPEYTMTQLDGATSMWVLSHDPRWLRLMNLFFNQLRPRLDGSFTLDATGGTRFSGRIPFYSGGLAVLYDSGDRPDLAPLVAGDLVRLEAEYTNTGNYTSQNFYRGLSGWLSMIVLDRQRPGGLLSGGPAIPPTAPTSPPASAPSRPSTPAQVTTPRPGPARTGAAHAAARTTRGGRVVVEVTRLPGGAEVDVRVLAARRVLVHTARRVTHGALQLRLDPRARRRLGPGRHRVSVVVTVTAGRRVTAVLRRALTLG